MALVITKFILVMLSSSYNNTQNLDHCKSTSISQLTNEKTRDLSKLLRYLSGIVTSVFNSGIGGCSGCGS